jgi:hypothetical protein
MGQIGPPCPNALTAGRPDFKHIKKRTGGKLLLMKLFAAAVAPASCHGEVAYLSILRTCQFRFGIHPSHLTWPLDERLTTHDGVVTPFRRRNGWYQRCPR